MERAHDLRRVIINAIALAAEVDAGSIQDDTDLLELGLDSLSIGEVLVSIEDQVGEQVPLAILDRIEEVGELTTLSDLCAFLSGWTPSSLVH